LNSQKLKVGIVGLGTVGGGLYDISKNNKEFEIVKVLNRSREKYKIHNIKSHQIASNLEELLNSVDIVVETVGGVEFATEVVKNALKFGKHVVTANKALIAKDGVELLKLAKNVEKFLLFGASVGGGMPVFRNLKYHSIGRISRVYGVLNATSNFVLSKVMEGMKIKDAVYLAQSEGYTESDPTDDLSGKDAARKLAIICAFITGSLPKVESIPTTSLNVDEEVVKFIEKMEMVLKPLVYMEPRNKGVELWVGPAAISRNSRIGLTEGTENCLIVEGENGINSISGVGAGKNPTAFAIMADIISIVRGEASEFNFNQVPLNILKSKFESVGNVKIFRSSR